MTNVWSGGASREDKRERAARGCGPPQLATLPGRLETVNVLWIKICATTNLDDALASLDAGANALGFILTASPRQIAPEEAAKIIAALPPSVEKIGVVVNETPEALAKLATDVGLTGLQLHGDEPPAQLGEFRRALGLRKIIKTRGSFPTEEAAIKLLYLALARVVAKWETVQHWKQMLNYLDTVCSERIGEAGVRR